MPKACIYNSTAHLVNLDTGRVFCDKEINGSETISKEVFIDKFLEELEKNYNICEDCIDEIDDLYAIKKFKSS